MTQPQSINAVITTCEFHAWARVRDTEDRIWRVHPKHIPGAKAGDAVEFPTSEGRKRGVVL